MFYYQNISIRIWNYLRKRIILEKQHELLKWIPSLQDQKPLEKHFSRKLEVRNAKQMGVFKKVIITQEKENCFFPIHNPVGANLLTCLRLRLRHLNEHKFRNGFEDTIIPLCSCNTEIQCNNHFLLRCHFYSSQRLELFDNFNKFNSSFFWLSAKDQVSILLQGYS